MLRFESTTNRNRMQAFSLAWYDVSMARQPDGQAAKRDEIRRLHRLGLKPREIAEKSGAGITYTYSVLNRWEFGPAGKQGQRIEAIYEMTTEILALLRQLTKLPRAEVIKRMAEIDATLAAQASRPIGQCVVNPDADAQAFDHQSGSPVRGVGV
jgi:hypothetical protein